MCSNIGTERGTCSGGVVYVVISTECSVCSNQCVKLSASPTVCSNQAAIMCAVISARCSLCSNQYGV